jgi:SM-20-related protein
VSAAPGAAVDFSPIVDGLERAGWSVAPEWVPPARVAALAGELRRDRAAGAFRAAGVGRAGRLATTVRGDEIRWLDQASAGPAVRAVFDRFEQLRAAVNRALQLGAIDLELHFAVYPVGAAYARHRDRFRDDDARVLSLVLYLNESWDEADGGALRLHLGDRPRAPFVDVAPRGGTLVAFLSDRFPHEVLAARRERLSLAGWFRRRAIGR